jgi:hypothetical protein
MVQNVSDLSVDESLFDFEALLDFSQSYKCKDSLLISDFQEDNQQPFHVVMKSCQFFTLHVWRSCQEEKKKFPHD